ncbi:OmpA family protein [Flavobacterium sp. '19STA2R22 D10 B1']|uniref:OmpA family protein n=1 Tax=Flavobacterium aerium TaxID=3037261 RepID=UPI00278BE239|nr:OmpA family protein [Flavobacterium sp. '19STA2R22 D10 B1']
MKKSLIYSLIGAFLFSSAFTSCDSAKNMNNTQKGAGIGVAAGAVLGGILGNNLGNKKNSALGAVLGGVLGGAAGGLIGNKMDKQARQISDAIPGADVERVGEGIKLVLNENAIRFDTNKSTLTATAQQNLDKLVSVFKEYPDTDIQIYGYTDNTGRAEYNKTLSAQRAESVKTYLSGKGINSGRFKITGMGIEEPIATNDTPEGRSQNRRVEFAITANQKMVNDAQKETKN